MGFLFDQQLARPEQINPPLRAFDLVNRFFVNGDSGAFDAEDVKEKVIPKGLGMLVLVAIPFVGCNKSMGARTQLVGR
jgi:hypothetical protein